MTLNADRGVRFEVIRMPGPWHELPYSCNPCKKGFQNRSQLKIHEGTQAHLNKRIALASASDNARQPCGQGALLGTSLSKGAPRVAPLSSRRMQHCNTSNSSTCGVSYLTGSRGAHGPATTAAGCSTEKVWPDADLSHCHVGQEASLVGVVIYHASEARV